MGPPNHGASQGRGSSRARTLRRQHSFVAVGAAVSRVRRNPPPNCPGSSLRLTPGESGTLFPLIEQHYQVVEAVDTLEFRELNDFDTEVAELHDL
jgi:hypothetical protein